MKLTSSFRFLTALIASAVIATFALAHEAHNKGKADTPSVGSLIKVEDASVSAEWLSQAKTNYPLDSCMISEDKLEDGDMGPPLDFVYRQEGQPDRLVRLCCKHCVRDFKKAPASYLQQIDDAAAARGKAAPQR